MDVICISSDPPSPSASRPSTSVRTVASPPPAPAPPARNKGKGKAPVRNSPIRSLSPIVNQYRGARLPSPPSPIFDDSSPSPSKPGSFEEVDGIESWDSPVARKRVKTRDAEMAMNWVMGATRGKRIIASTKRTQMEDNDDIIIIDDTPAKPSGASAVLREKIRANVPKPTRISVMETVDAYGPAKLNHEEFSADTASILKKILGNGNNYEDGDAHDDHEYPLQKKATARKPAAVKRAPAKTLAKTVTRKRNSGDSLNAEDDTVLPKSTRRKVIEVADLVELPALAPVEPVAAKRKATKFDDPEKIRKAEEKPRKAAEKEVEREAKRLEKEAKLLEKQKEQELASVNKLKTSKKDTVKEMIVDIEKSFSESESGKQLQRFLETQGCENTATWEPPVPNVVKWRRRTTARWSDELGHFVPVKEEVTDERHILVVVKADEFVDMAMGDVDLQAHVARVKSLLGAANAALTKAIYMIEGLTTLIRKARVAKSRNFQAAVRHETSAPASSRRGRVRRNGARDLNTIDEDAIEDALLSLQIAHECFVHQTMNMQETSEWISIFTGDISTIPYKMSRMTLETAFCADGGQVKAGHDAEDTFFKMLQQVTRVTAGVANGIMGEYTNVAELVEGLKAGGENAIADMEIMANKQGTSSGRAIGPATSKRIYKIFMGTDPDSIDV